MTSKPPCRHPQLTCTFVGRRRYDWRAECLHCGYRWRPESPNVPERVETFVAGVAGHMTWHGFVLDYRPLDEG